MDDLFQCHQCKKGTEYNTVTISFGYGSKFDGDNFLFCSDECLKQWVSGGISMG